MKSTVAFLAMPPDHSTSRSASPISETLSADRPVHATLVLMQTMFSSGALNPAAARKAVMSVSGIYVCPATATCIPEPV